VERIHIIDGCQALGSSVDAKYERLYGSGRDVKHIRDGASLPRLFSMLNASSRPLCEWALFASQCDLPISFVSKELAALSKQVHDEVGSIVTTVLAAGAESQTVGRIAAATAKECERQILMAPKIAKVSVD
jgi:hypothetical protein